MENLNKIIRFDEAKKRKDEEELIEAYEWAVAEQKYYGLLAQPVRLDIKDGDLTEPRDGFLISVFYNAKTGMAILRRDWDEDCAVQYNILVNHDEVDKIAPTSLAKLKQNGLELFNKYKKLR